MKNRWASLVSKFSSKPRLILKGRGSKHPLICNWLGLSWADISVEVNEVVLTAIANAKGQLLGFQAEVTVNRTNTNLSHGLAQIKKDRPAILHVHLSWPWGRPEYELSLAITDIQTSCFGAKQVFRARVDAVRPQRDGIMLLPSFDRVQQQAKGLNQILREFGVTGTPVRFVHQGKPGGEKTPQPPSNSPPPPPEEKKNKEEE